MTSADTIMELVEKTKEKCLSWLRKSEGMTQFIDPLDGKEISEHYGASHAAVALLLWGIRQHDKELESIGEMLLKSVLDRWSENSKHLGFHNDFNNFALCVAWDCIHEISSYADITAEIKKVVISTADSNHDTVNWIPMRWYVNKCRYQWTNEQRYQEKIDVCAKKIREATYKDGFIDDRLPKGLSFNLQYDIATVAIMQFLRVHGEDIDISKETGALLNAVAPDGDINYLGRGTNQIFAWALWIYLLASAGLETELQKALGYCAEKIPVMLANNNLMLNEWDGSEKYLWWDYHYCSVYTAHLFFWLVLAIEDMSKMPIQPIISDNHDSGLEIVKSNGWFIALFSGRKKYLSEKGPTIAALFNAKNEVLHKGTFGPWKGTFGEKYFLPSPVANSYLGLIEISVFPKTTANKFLRKIKTLIPEMEELRESPLFDEVDFQMCDEGVNLIFNNPNGHAAMLNIPIAVSLDIKTLKLCLTVDGSFERIYLIGSYRNQYGFSKLYQSGVCRGQKWVLYIGT